MPATPIGNTCRVIVGKAVDRPVDKIRFWTALGWFGPVGIT